MALEHLFQGSALNAVDAKGRVSIPAFLRGVIERRGDARTIVLAKHEAFPCLSAYDPGYAALRQGKAWCLASTMVRASPRRSITERRNAGMETRPFASTAFSALP